MSCVLRAHGTEFDVESYIGGSPLAVDSHWIRGAPRVALQSRPDRTSASSGIRVIASEAEFDAFPEQVKDVQSFLATNREALLQLIHFPGVEGAELDFGIEIHPPGTASCSLPPQLMEVASSLGLSVTISVYPVNSSNDADV